MIFKFAICNQSKDCQNLIIMSNIFKISSKNIQTSIILKNTKGLDGINEIYCPLSRMSVRIKKKERKMDQNNKSGFGDNSMRVFFLKQGINQVSKEGLIVVRKCRFNAFFTFFDFSIFCSHTNYHLPEIPT